MITPDQAGGRRLVNRWSGLIGIAVGNLLPLWLVWRGDLEVGDLVLVYLLELGIAFALASATAGSWGRSTSQAFVKVVGSWFVAAVLFVPYMIYLALRFVTWDVTTVMLVLATLASNLVGFAATLRRQGSTWQQGLPGAYIWRFFLMVIALMAAHAGQAYERLLAADWEPSRFGNGWALPAGELLVDLALAADVSPMVLAAGMLCSYRLVAELLYEVFDIQRQQVREARAS